MHNLSARSGHPFWCLSVLNKQKTKYICTWLLGRFAPIFYWNIKHFLFVYIVKQKQTKSSRILQYNLMDFQNLIKIKFCWRLNFEILSIHNHSPGSCAVPHNIWARSVRPFWRLLDINCLCKCTQNSRGIPPPPIIFKFCTHN